MKLRTKAVSLLGACAALGAFHTQPLRAAEAGWFPFQPPADAFATNNAIDLRWLNEKEAGAHGAIAAKGDEFVFSGTGQPVRFWAVNGPPSDESGEQLKKTARRLAKYGVNLARIHTPVFDDKGAADPKKIAHAQETTEAMKAEGIYTLASIYFPLWFKPGPDHPWLKGYDGNTHPFAALMFHPEFQEQYRQWWKQLLLTPNPRTGRRLVDDPALMGLEIQNEDSFFFWTFNPERLPDQPLRILEKQYGDWLKQKYGSLETALERWGRQSAKRDSFGEGRAGFRPLYNVFTEKSARDRDMAAFLFEKQKGFYEDTYRYLRSLGFKGVITASNWATASPEVFGPLEKMTYAVTDFIDRHGYFSVSHRGQEAAWSIRNGHTYTDRSALRFDSATPGKPKEFVHPVMDPAYNEKPSMISETTWNRPNRFRSEAPLYFAAYGALQGSDAIVHFALDGSEWSVKPRFWMQPWTLMAPSQMGQFPAAALIYRQGLVKKGEVMARLQLNQADLLALKGTPLPQDASFDELRLKDVPQGSTVEPGQRIDPLIHYIGQVKAAFTNAPAQFELADLKPFLDRSRQTVRSSSGELTLDYGKGALTINAPAAQGVSGNLKGAGAADLRDVAIASALDNAHIIVVALDQQPLSTSRRMLAQAMSEEKATGFEAEPGEGGLLTIKNIGKDPWLARELSGTVRFKSGRVQIQPLDLNGYPAGTAFAAQELKLDPKTVYYLITR